MYDALTIAKWFVAFAEADEADSSNLKIQKLLYYAQGHHLAETGERLFSDPIQAWSHGPVVPSIYHAFKQFRSGDVHLDATDPFSFDDVDPTTTQFLLRIWNTYAQYSPWGLRNMTHAELPWSATFDGGRNVEIPVGLLQSYFATR